MPEVQYLFLTQPDRELVTAIDRGGPIECGQIPPISLSPAPNLEEMIHDRFRLALRCEYDPANSPVPVNDIRSHLEVFAIGLQLIRPVEEFSDHWLTMDSATHRIRMRSASLALPEDLSGPLLAYQQHHATTPGDVQRAIGLLPL